MFNTVHLPASRPRYHRRSQPKKVHSGTHGHCGLVCQKADKLGTQTHQPGHYSLSVNDDQRILTITPAKDTANEALVDTRLAAPEPPASGAHVVFDKVGDLYYLSEVWIPGYDGFLLYSAKEKHTHARVKLVPKR